MRIWKKKISQTPKPLGPFPDLIARVLASREVSQDQVDLLLNPKLSTLKDPLSLYGMGKACERLTEAFRKKEKICIYADFDLDGTSGLAILKIGLESIGYQDVSYYQPRRLNEGYGFHAEAVEELKNIGIDLIITVDVGITSHKAFEKAKELGIDVILTDHHLSGETLPEAFAIVNPNQPLDTSGLGYLCGAGVAFYLLRALKRAFFESSDLPKKEWDLKSVLDYFCIGTVTDMVPLVEDNRVLVKHGLYALSQTDKPGLKALLEELNLNNRELSSQDVAIRFAPKLNALSRMESDILPAQIYLEKDYKKAKQMVQQVLENNQTRQTLQIDAEKKAFDELLDWPHKEFVFVCSKYFHRGIIGLIATKLAQHYNCPAFVGSQNSEGVIVGSARVPQDSDLSLVDILKYSENVLTRFGGHAAAAGFELHAINKESFVMNLEKAIVTEQFENKPVEIPYDTTAELAELSQHTMKWYDSMGPYGVGFQVPLLEFCDVEIISKKELKGGHLKLNVSDKEKKHKLDALVFSPSEKIKKALEIGKSYRLLSELQWNYFNGQKSIQLLVKDLKVYES